MNLDPSPEPPRRWQAPFFTIWTGQAFSLLGSQLVQFALIWWLTKLTGSATMLAFATLFGLLPQVLLSPFAGALVDRLNRRRVILLADAGVAVVSLGLAGLFAAGLAQPWHIFAAMLLREIGGAFHQPAMQASTTLMVPKQHLSRIAGLNQMLFGLLAIASAPLGALLLELLPMQGVLLVDVGTALLAIAPLLFVRIPQPAPSEQTGAAGYWADLRAGFRYVLTWPGLLALLLMAAFLNFLLTPTGSLLPLLVNKHFGGEAIQLGLVNSAQGVGMLAGGLLLSVWGGFRRRIVTSMVGLIGMGMGVAVVGIAPAGLFTLAIAGMAWTGFMLPITNGPLHAVVQGTVEPAMQGRVLSLINATAMGMTPISLAVAGPVSDWLGIQVWYLIAGVACSVMGVVGFLIPALMNIEQGRRIPAAEAPAVE